MPNAHYKAMPALTDDVFQSQNIDVIQVDSKGYVSIGLMNLCGSDGYPCHPSSSWHPYHSGMMNLEKSLLMNHREENSFGFQKPNGWLTQE
jgi:hypothetical protein